MIQTQTQSIKAGLSQERWLLILLGESSITNTTARIDSSFRHSRKILMAILLALFLLSGITPVLTRIVNAAACGVTVINPFTSKLDCIGTAIPQTGTVGQCLQIISLSPFTIGWATCGSTPTVDFLLTATGDFMVMATGDYIVLPD